MDISAKQLRITLKSLILEKKKGELDVPDKFNNQYKKWRNVVNYEILWKCIKHHCHEVRRDVIELLVVSKKSTHRFVKVEFQLIETFLTYNLGEKIDFVPLIKKAIKRTKDSLILLQREFSRMEKIQSFQDNHLSSSDSIDDVTCNFAKKAQLKLSIDEYKAFIISLRAICINSLYPTANYERRRSSLQILCHMQDILDEEIIDLRWDKSHAKSLFDCLLLDTYESNKDMAYKVLRPMPPSLLELDNEYTVGEIIDTAIRLANSIRPVDSTTAAYMLKICIASPIIVGCVVRQRQDFQTLDADDDTDIHLTLVNLLILQLKKPLEIARENIVKAASKHSLYGYIFCLRSLISDRNLHLTSSANHGRWKEFIANIVDMCFDLNQTVGQIVNNSSPEGHLPMDQNPHNLCSSLFNQELLDAIKLTTPQMVLLCAWRTVKEVSLLFGYLTANLQIDEVNGSTGLLTEQQLTKIGEHFVNLLSETKHRGAFEQAHVGFGQLCGRLWHESDNQTLKNLPKIWLLELLLAVTGLTQKDSKLCATRRSAGVPFMVQALLTSEESSRAVIKHGGSPTFHSTMRILLGLTNLKNEDDLDAKIITLIYQTTTFAQFRGLLRISDQSATITTDATDTGKCHRLAEIKTHVINILRALFRHCQLGECVKPYIADGVICAINSYNGRTWAERNAATLLFSAMIVRIFGVQRTKDHLNLSLHNKMTGKVFFEKYPNLLGFMYAELEEFVKPGDTLIRPGVQSVLLLLSRLYPGCHDSADNSNWKVTEFIHMVSKCAKSQVYETRELAARALVPLLTETTALPTFSKILKIISTKTNNYSNINMIHGYMLQILQISKNTEFAKLEPSSTQLKHFLKNSLWILKNLENQTGLVGISFPLATTYLETLFEIYRKDQWLDKYVQDEELDLFYRMRLHLIQGDVLSNNPGREIYEIAAAKFFTHWCISALHDFRDADMWTQDKNVTNTWTPLLHHDNMDVRVIAWIKSTELVGTNICRSFYISHLQGAISEAAYAIEQSIKDPYLEGTVFDFLYVVFTDTSDSNFFKTNASSFPNLLESIMAHLSKKMSNKDYYIRDGFLRLLGVVYGELLKHNENIPSIDEKKSIYELFLQNSWMDSCDSDCRLAVSKTVYNLYQSVDKKSDCFVIYWWTMLLNLLNDDDRTVRQHAAEVACKIDSQTDLICDVGMRQQFFDKFSSIVATERPDLAAVALFSWGVATWREDDHETDDTDVFNKCKNYETFEQLEISNLCWTFLNEIRKNYSFESKLHWTCIEWLETLYDCEFSFETLAEFVKLYQKSIPVLDSSLDAYLDPTYGNKLQQVLAFQRFSDLICNDQGLDVRAISGAVPLCSSEMRARERE